jgi:transposase
MAQARRQQRSPMERYGLRDFERDFPDDAACLEWLHDYLYPDGVYCAKCEAVTKHHRVESRPSYSCDRCGRHEHPTAGTIFQDSRTPLRLWFRAIFLMAQTRCGISAKQLEREIGVTYKTAWRMFHLIRSLLVEDDGPLGGEVEVDETYIGGRARYPIHGDQPRAIREAKARKITVQGFVERGGRVRAVVNPPSPLAGNVREYVMPDAMVFTDDAAAYTKLHRLGYQHRRIQHSKRIYVFGNTHTNTIEGFWSLVKRGIGGVYHNVSAKYLQMYFDEYGFRYNHRMDVTPMFQTFLRQIAKASAD